MLMNEVRKKTGLTRKAVKYYEEKGFINPEREENNYRVYSDEDVDILKNISMYRKLGCTTDEIKDILKGVSNSSLATIIRDREIKSQLENTRVETLKLLLDGSEAEKVNERLDVIDKQETIYFKLKMAFPGYFGQVFFLSYKPFLGDKLEEDKIKYYNQYIDFLDTMPDKVEAIYNTEEWLNENKDMLERYKSFKESDFYLNNPIYRIQEKTKKYMEDSCYYEKAIPLIRKFSPAYDAYYKQLLEANQKLLDIDNKSE